MNKMKFYIVFKILFALSYTCQGQSVDNLLGVYYNKESGEKIEFKADNTYIFYNSVNKVGILIEQCDYASYGRWSSVNQNILEIESADFYEKEKGFEYELVQERKFSDDSLYFKIEIPMDTAYINFHFTFNYKVSKSIMANQLFIAIPKEKHLRKRNLPENLISFCIEANLGGTYLYRSRVLFEYFEEKFDTEAHNHITISIPNFDICFFELQPYYKDLIFIKNKSEIYWKGAIWKKQ